MSEINVKNRVDPSKYIVLDVETNGLSSVRDDLLSISIFKPDTKKAFNRFLPLELNSEVLTTSFNGIKTEDLVGLLPLSQDEVDEIIDEFELKQRIILTYGVLDERFIVKYFKRHKLKGLEYFAFYNFKHEIISSRFSEGNITKDNLCRIYGIENIQKIHSGVNDCILEWSLFERMNGKRLLVTNNKVFEFNNEYIVPASFIALYPNLKYYLPHLPKINCNDRVLYWEYVSSEKLKKFPTNFNGMILEHVINSMLNVQKTDSTKQLLENKKRLTYLGELPSNLNIVPMVFNPDGSMKAVRPQDQEMEEQINAEVDELKIQLVSLVEFIRDQIFKGKPIYSQELVVNHKDNILALCDLSNENAILEIKATDSFNLKKYKEQLYYEAAGRKCFILLTNWMRFTHRVEIKFDIHEVIFSVEENDDREKTIYKNAKRKIETDEIELISYINASSPVRVRCKKCGDEWNMSYKIALKQQPCPNCNPYREEPDVSKKRNKDPIETLTKEERRVFNKYMRSKLKIERISNHKITITAYKDSKTPVKAKCLECGFEWEARFDKLLEKPFCQNCKK